MTSDRPNRQPLFRETLGSHLRELRHARGERLSDTAERAGISTQYLSEIERGRKDPSSEMVEAVAGALGSSAGEVAVVVGHRMMQTSPVTVLRSRRFDAPAPASRTGDLLALAA